jgi:dTDP-4-dehydrorhamnose 3,5-epimerase-like enzyme
MAKTDIPGLLVIALAVFGDARGWPKENYNRDPVEL